MLRRDGIPCRVLFIMFFLVLPALALAQDGLHISDIILPDSGAKASEAKVSVYFSIRKNQKVVYDITADDCVLRIDSKRPEIVKQEVKPFIKGDRGVGVLFVFPIAKNYSEEHFGIRSALGTLVKLFERPVDMLNIVTYDTNATPVGWSRASESSLSQALNNMQNSEVLEPNLFLSFSPALLMLQSLKNVSQKYIVIISDAEGAIVGDTDRSNELIGVFIDELIKNNIIPIVIAYTPDGREAMPNSRLLMRIALNAGGAYYMAESSSAFQKVIQRDVYDYIFGQYIYEATLNTKGSKYLKPDEHQLEFEVITDRRTAKKKINWPKLK